MKTALASIVILTKNGGEVLKESIRQLYSQKTSFNYEVIVVDSGSTDGTLEFLKNHPVKLFQILPRDFLFGKTRDFGFSKARGEYIVTLSQDAIPSNENWLQSLIDPLLNNEADVVQGCLNIPKDRKVFFWEDRSLFYFTSEGREFRKTHGNTYLSCTCLAIKKKVWEENKFGNISMGEDIMLQKKIYNNGYKIFVQNNAVVYHGHNYHLLSLMKRCENEGMGWRLAGVRYSFFQMLADLVPKKWLYGILARAILKKKITDPAEILFFIIRPIFVYKGNLLNKRYKY